jgi:hypothetical protein
MLFIGQGTFSFCNYWAKVFTSIIHSAGTVLAQEADHEAVIEAIRRDPATVQALRLVLRYARAESLVGFGKYAHEKNLVHFRMLLVQAMEMFIVGHELGHFFLEEQYPELNGVPPDLTPHSVELLCDIIGFSVCTADGHESENELSRHLIGPLLLLYALKLSEDVQNTLLNTRQEASDTHPGLAERIQNLFKYARAIDPTGALYSSMEETLDYAAILGAQVKTVISHISDSDSEVNSD